MSLSTQLTRWQAAGLIDPDTAQRIAAFERSQQRPLLLYTLGGLGGLTIGLGAISVVAANWQGIPIAAKLTADFLLLAGLAAASYVAIARGWSLAREILIAVFYLFHLASLALLGQIYQSSTEVYVVLAGWSLATLPLLLHAESRAVGVLWAMGLLATASSFLEMDLAEETLVSLALTAPLVFVGFGRFVALGGGRRQVGAALSGFGWLCLFTVCGAISLLWYLDSHANDPPVAVLTFTVAGTLFGAALGALYPEMRRPQRYALCLFLFVSVVSLAAHAFLDRAHWPVMGATVQIGQLALLAVAAAQAGRLQSFNLLTGLLAMRLLVLYFEAFGSLLDSGVAMISGGLLTLALAWLWRRLSPTLARWLVAEEA